MATTHVCMTIYYVKTRTGEIRLIVTKAYIAPSLKNDLIPEPSRIQTITELFMIKIPKNQDFPGDQLESRQRDFQK
jgi:hypothetical protein